MLARFSSLFGKGSGLTDIRKMLTGHRKKPIEEMLTEYREKPIEEIAEEIYKLQGYKTSLEQLYREGIFHIKLALHPLKQSNEIERIEVIHKVFCAGYEKKFNQKSIKRVEDIYSEFCEKYEKKPNQHSSNSKKP